MDWGVISGELLALGGALLTGGMWLRQKLANQKLETVKYNTETELINSIRTSLKDALVRIDILNAEIESLKRIVDDKNLIIDNKDLLNKELQREISSLKGEISLLIDLVNRLSNTIR